MLEYRGEIIEKMGYGFKWNNFLWPTWETLTANIDNYLDTK